MTQSPIPKEEIEVFKQLGPMSVIFDVGARTDTDYIGIHPEAEFHLFEPNPIFFGELAQKVLNRANVTVNRCGLGNKSGLLMYNDLLQAFEGGAQDLRGSMGLPVETLDWYTDRESITHIDFLKIDTEGYDLNVLKGGEKTLKKTRFIQYEHWGEPNNLAIQEFLGNAFEVEYIGYRNCLCMNTKLVPKKKRARIVSFIRENNYKDLA